MSGSMEHFTGLLPETAGQRQAWRDGQMSLPPMAGSEIAETLFADPPAWMPIENQKATNECAAHAGTSVMEKLAYMLGGEFVQLCRNYVYKRGQEACGLSGDVGCTLGGIIDALKHRGAPPESLWPFTGVYQPKIPVGLDEVAAQRKATRTINVESLGYEGFRTVIGQNIGGVLMACSWPLTLVDGYVVEKYAPTGRGGHALAALFLSTRKDSRGQPYVWVANSHSTNSGRNGWLLWSPSAIDSVIQRAEWGSTAITDMVIPKPRPYDWKQEGGFFA